MRVSSRGARIPLHRARLCSDAICYRQRNSGAASIGSCREKNAICGNENSRTKLSFAENQLTALDTNSLPETTGNSIENSRWRQYSEESYYVFESRELLARSFDNPMLVGRFVVTRNRFDFLVNNLSPELVVGRSLARVLLPSSRLMEINNPSTFSGVGGVACSIAYVLGTPARWKKGPSSVW